jgi:hypothetical protein
MTAPQIDYEPVGPGGMSGGTTSLDWSRLGSSPALIAAESVLMIGSFTLEAAPLRSNIDERTSAQPEVIASLERSLQQNADIWAELSQY